MAAVIASVLDMRPPIITIHPRSKDDFSEFSMDDQLQNEYSQGIEALKKEARSMLMAATSAKLMILIDAVECLGLAYHFEREIEEKLQHLYEEEDNADYNLFTTALRFRLLRQHQHHVSCSVFDKFMNKEGKFEEGLISDVEGLLSLYDAAYLQMNGEQVLQEALTFTTHHLTQIAPQLDDHSPLKLKMNRALEYPLHREVTIIHAHVFISIYERDDSRDEVLLKLAKMNFNFLQNLYKKELSQLSRWWNKYDLKSDLTYLRDNLVSSYLWGVAFHFEPQYADVRTAITICLQIITVMDDTYDNYATMAEAQLLTEALERWDVDEIDTLPDYMKIVYRFIICAVEDLEKDVTKEQMFAVPYFKEEVKRLGRGYNKELKWVMTKQMPSFDEYVKNYEITSCVNIMITSVFPFLKSATQETIEWLLSDPSLAISTGMIARFSDDLGSYERESKGGEMLTALECYMKQHGTSKQETVSKFRQVVEDELRTLNQEWINTTCLPKEVVEMFLSYARATDFTYKNYGDAYSNPKRIEKYINALFVNPLLIN